MFKVDGSGKFTFSVCVMKQLEKVKLYQKKLLMDLFIYYSASLSRHI